MGILNMFGGSKGPAGVIDDPIARAVLTPAISTMVGDGEVSEAEIAQINNLIAFSPIFFEHGPATVTAYIQHTIDTIAKKGHDETIKEAAAQLSQPLRETAMCFAIRMALADGKIEEGEKNSLMQTGHYMEISGETFKMMFEVLVMLQRPPETEQRM